MSKLWGGRFEEKTDQAVEAYTSSLAIDSRLFEADLLGSIAHARMLGATGILPAAESEQIVQALGGILEKAKAGKLQFDPQAEDIHSEIERFLREKLGPLAGKLHTARSRNDQVATATRLYARGRLEGILQELRAIQAWIVTASERHLLSILPGMTHTQHAQPVSLAHHLMAYFWMFERDRSRFHECLKRTNQLPLGSAALAGTSFPVDREQVARELGFEGVCENSLDAVSDRDFVAEILSSGSLVMMHLSRICEELIWWSTPEFGFVELSDRVTTGSSIMPQKKNPDVAELVRGRAGRLTGSWVGMMTTLKALPLAYNRDLQEDKHYLWEGLDTVESSLGMVRLMLETARFRTEEMRKKLVNDYSNATDIADFLVRHGMPFRDAHEVTGKIVRYCLEKKIGIEDLSLEQFRGFHGTFDSSILKLVQPEEVMKARSSQGGTGPDAVKAQITLAKARLN